MCGCDKRFAVSTQLDQNTMMMGDLCRLLLHFLAFQVAIALIVPTEPKRCPRFAAHDGEEESGDWQTIGEIATITSPWLSIYCERIIDVKGKTLDYWRVEKDHSVIVLAIHENRLVFPNKQYRPGVKVQTLDFAGGRSSTKASPVEAVNGILKRELGVDLEKDVLELYPLNENSGWLINSSFSNQMLFGFVAVLRGTSKLDPTLLYSKSYSIDDRNEMNDLLRNELTCVQCRAVLMEYLIQQLPEQKV
jgi:hypothetical protein